MNESVCDVYVALADGLPHTVTMELCIPYQDLLKYQAFQLYPNALVGELKELVQTSMEGFVREPINPSVVKERIEFLDDETLSESFPTNIGIIHEFTQVGNPATIVTEMIESTENATGHLDMTDATGTDIHHHQSFGSARTLTSQWTFMMVLYIMDQLHQKVMHKQL